MDRNNLLINRLFLICVLIFVLGFGKAWAQKQKAQHYTVKKISSNSNIRTDRRPIHIGYYDPEVKKTFVCWMGARSAVVVKAYDHLNHRWSNDKIVAASPFVDKHNYPGMLRGGDGRIYIFYGCHNSTMKMAISPKAGSIEGTWNEKFIDAAQKASYPAPVITEDGTMYVFYRYTRKTNGYSDDRPYQMVKSTDGGKTWKRQTVIDPFPRTADNMTEIYNGKITYEPADNNHAGKIHIAWTIAGEKKGRHAHATYGRNIYYAYLNTVDDHMYNVEGKDLGKTVDDGEADRYCLAWDSGMPDRGHYGGLQVSVRYKKHSVPLVYFYNQKEGGTSSITWDGSKWFLAPISPEGGDPRGFEKIGPESFRVYRPSGDSVKLYKTTDGGFHWGFEDSFYVGEKISRVNVIDNYQQGAKLLLTEDGNNELIYANRDVFIGKVADQKD